VIEGRTVKIVYKTRYQCNEIVISVCSSSFFYAYAISMASVQRNKERKIFKNALPTISTYRLNEEHLQFIDTEHKRVCDHLETIFLL
jgi:hypothetical protein